MLYVPTWLDNLILVVAFAVLARKYDRVGPERPVFNVYFMTMAGCVVSILVIALLNAPGSWLSLAFFGESVLFALLTWYLYRATPPKPAEH